jgi:hypothetical protein
LVLEAFGRGEWTKEIFTDPVTGLVYTTTLRSGILRFFLIDLRTGGLKQVLSVVHAFPEKPGIYHNHLFYLYDVPGEGDNKHLFRQKL